MDSPATRWSPARKVAQRNVVPSGDAADHTQCTGCCPWTTIRNSALVTRMGRVLGHLPLAGVPPELDTFPAAGSELVVVHRVCHYGMNGVDVLFVPLDRCSWWAMGTVAHTRATRCGSYQEGAVIDRSPRRQSPGDLPGPQTRGDPTGVSALVTSARCESRAYRSRQECQGAHADRMLCELHHRSTRPQVPHDDQRLSIETVSEPRPGETRFICRPVGIRRRWCRTDRSPRDPHQERQPD